MEQIKNHNKDWDYPKQFLSLDGTFKNAQIQNSDVMLYIEQVGEIIGYSTNDLSKTFEHLAKNFHLSGEKKRSELCRSYSGFFGRIAQVYRQTQDTREIAQYFNETTFSDSLNPSELDKIVKIKRNDILFIEWLNDAMDYISIIIDGEILIRIPLYRIEVAITQRIKYIESTSHKNSRKVLNKQLKLLKDFNVFLESVVNEYYRKGWKLYDDRDKEVANSKRKPGPKGNKFNINEIIRIIDHEYSKNTLLSKNKTKLSEKIYESYTRCEYKNWEEISPEKIRTGIFCNDNNVKERLQELKSKK